MAEAGSHVGPLAFPLAPLAAGERLADRVVETVLDYAAHWLRVSLNPALSTLVVTEPGAVPATSADAVPATNRFSFDPRHPRGHHIKLPVPSLFAWWPTVGEGGEASSQTQALTIVYSYRRRDLHLMWVYNELPSLEAMQQRAGILAAADAALQMAFDWAYHPTWVPPGLGTNGDPWAIGTPLPVVLGGVDVFAATLTKVTQGRFGIDDLTTTIEPRPTSGRDHPALFVELSVQERIGSPTVAAQVDPSSFLIRGAEGGTLPEEPIEFMRRTAPAPED